MKILQIVPNLYKGDAVGNEVLSIDRVLREAGYDTAIYSPDIDPRLKLKARPFAIIPKVLKEDIIIYHVAVANEALFTYIRSIHCIRIMRYHNITPPEFYRAYNDTAVYACEHGIEEVRAMNGIFDHCLCVSEYNAGNLKHYGYCCPMTVLPIVLSLSDYDKAYDVKTYSRYNDGRTNIVFVGRVAPNKKFEDLITTFYYYRKYWDPKARLLLVGSYDRTDRYYLALQDHIKKNGIKGVVFTGHIPFAGILACYQAADVFLCLSEHEGFCVPVVEAMKFGKPVIAYRSSAVPETLGEQSILLDKKDPVETAGMIHHLLTDDKLRQTVIDNQTIQLKKFDQQKTERRFLEFIQSIAAKG